MQGFLALSRRAIGKARRLSSEAFLAFPKLRKCNICGWRGRRFLSDQWHPFTICPRCRSGVRHRLLIAALAGMAEVSFAKIVDGKTVLHFAPEAVLKGVLRGRAGLYLTADFTRTDVDRQLDLSDLSALAAETFDLLIACDVLEHVPDDHRAMREIHRVLRRGGYAILTVPQQDGLAETFEDATITDPRERERVFGQWDHLRIYGASFPQLLEVAGFQVKVIDERDFSEAQGKRWVLFPPVLSDKPLATNYRKVFFARKV